MTGNGPGRPPSFIFTPPNNSIIHAIESPKHIFLFADKTISAKSSQSEARVISVAMTCADAAYDHPITLEIQDPDLRFDRKDYIIPSIDGTTKGTAFTLVEEAAPQTPPDSLFPILVVAVRGSKNTVDWVVNANSQTRDSSELFVRILILRKDFPKSEDLLTHTLV